ncbi:hypothetical protein CS0771_76530 [Catellatospora sp. IY07-71]|uniref:hypothetical protein n=1 Tax=Catellatospora sp. IY07-71 TaxID=2728827 RepID=UPI001BB39D5D|nr:hypothetical protein [Catellatospora sp. IY07-71]BCJ78109.1 hypothetical protein CS0771_76530 [Catellatospora sp. IY07-71]
MARNNGVAASASQLKETLAESGRAVAAQAGEVRHTLAESGHTLATQAGEVKDQVAATAALARDKAGEVVHDLAVKMPSSSQEWEAAGRDVMDSVRRNPRPWVVGAAVVTVVWWLARKTKRSA